MNPSRIVLFAVLTLSALATAALSGAIHDAVLAGDAAGVARLLREDPGLVRAPSEGRFRDLPLHLAAAQGNLEVARLLLDAGADLDGGDSDESTPLHCAVLNRRAEMVRFLLDRGADVNRRDRNGACALSFAASTGDSGVVGVILEAGADLNFVDRQGTTLMHFACSRGLWDLADRLISRGHDLGCTNSRGITPLHLAAAGNDSATVEGTLARGADPNAADSSGATPLFNAVAAHADRSIRVLLDHGANPRVADHGGRTPLLIAAWHAQPVIVQALLEHGADPNQGDAQGAMPLASASRTGRMEVVDLLLAASADPNAVEGPERWTPLHFAAVRGQSRSVRALLEHGARPSVKNLDGLTPLDLATRYGHRGVAVLLEGAGGKGKRWRAEEPRGLAAVGAVAPGEAVVWNLGHSGWGIKTSRHFLVFDSMGDAIPPDQPSLANGFIDPAEISGENVTVFVSHSHADHFNPEIFSWRESVPGIRYIFGFAPADAPPVEVIAARETRTIDGMQVTAIRSNDTGVGFFVEVDGVAIFHAGDHANRNRDLSGDYMPEIEFLKERGVRPDIAFMPISGCGFGDQVAVRIGVEKTLDELHPAVFIPMHSGAFGTRYREFVSECQGSHSNVRMEALVLRGDRFHYRRNRTS